MTVWTKQTNVPVIVNQSVQTKAVTDDAESVGGDIAKNVRKLFQSKRFVLGLWSVFKYQGYRFRRKIGGRNSLKQER